jgi:ABC-type polysaccharide/polyol phosphate transport system ATPase subunit
MATVRLVDLSVDIPIYDVASTSIKRLLHGTTGGRFASQHAHVIVNALRKITFEAHDGDRIGLIGNNGSGKTTLLRVLARVYPPTGGTIEVCGRVSPMLNMTLGMSADATGFENIRICGALWGLTRKQIEASIDDIVDFTELGEYLNMPVRTYSAGMLLRLSFAIATLREPDILLIDEIIGVGDAGFLHKASARLARLVRQSRILFMASHVKSSIMQLCDKAIWLHNGSLVAYGPAEEVMARYERGDVPR